VDGWTLRNGWRDTRGLLSSTRAMQNRDRGAPHGAAPPSSRWVYCRLSLMRYPSLLATPLPPSRGAVQAFGEVRPPVLRLVSATYYAIC